MLNQPEIQLPIDQLTEQYIEIRIKHGLSSPGVSKRSVKRVIEKNVTNAIFSVPQYGKSQVVMAAEGIHKATWHAQQAQASPGDIKSLLKTADIIRTNILEARDNFQGFDGSLHHETRQNEAPTLLFTLLKWVMFGTAKKLHTKTREFEANSSVLNICQTIMYSTKSKRQVQYKPKDNERGFYQRDMSENSFVLGIGLSMHSQTRSKSVIDFLHACGVSVDYNRLLRVETMIANAVLKNIDTTGVYVPPRLMKSKVFFAADNIDWKEDTPDGKHTLHATVLVVFQPTWTDDVCDLTSASPPLEYSQTLDRGLKDVPDTMTKLEPCKLSGSFKPSDSIHTIVALNQVHQIA